MARVSELFVVDIEQFMGHLQAILAYTRSMMDEMKTSHVIPDNVLYNLEILSNKVCIIETILSLIKIKAQRFRPNNVNLHQALADLERDVKAMRSSIWMASQAYQRDPNFGINGIYKAIMDVGAYANTIRLKMNTFIQDGLFM